MADQEEDYLAARLEEDRRGMAQAVSELKNDYDIPQRLNASIRQHPWVSVFGAALIGWLLSLAGPAQRSLYFQTSFSGYESPGGPDGVRSW
jgi:hypothetical protein